MKRWNLVESFHLPKIFDGGEPDAMLYARRFGSCTGFRFGIVALAIASAAFAVRSSDTFQSAQLSALKAETARTVAAAVPPELVQSPATQITATKPRLLKPATAVLPPDMARPATPVVAAATDGIGNASPEDLCRALGQSEEEGSWSQSALFEGERECYSKQEGEGYELAKIARGKSSEQVDTIRFKLDLADENALAEASSDLKKELDVALETADLDAPSTFLEGVSNLEEVKAVDGPIAFTFEREIASQNRFNLIIRKDVDEGNFQLVKARPDLQ